MPDSPRLQLLGYWDSAQSYDISSCVGWIFPQHLQDPAWRPQQRAQIAVYLRSGAEWSGAMGSSTCRFDGCGGGHGSRDLTDGTWLWPEGLAHYVEAHNVRLPDAFVETAAASGFTVSPSAARDRRRGFDGARWLKWGAQQVPPSPPHPDAISLEAAQAIAADLSVAGCRLAIEAFHQQWLVTVTLSGGSAVDLLPPCSADALRLHLHRWRRVPEAQTISIQQMQEILDEVFPAAGLLSRLRSYLTNSAVRPTLKQTAPHGWFLHSGTQGQGVIPTDEIGWRYRLSMLTPGEPEPILSKRLFAVFGPQGSSER